MSTKKEFSFHLDRKVTIWVREHHRIKAESYDDAKRIMIEAFNNGNCDGTFSEQEYLFETEEQMDPGDNGGNTTLELFVDGGPDIDMIANNLDKNQ
jgi:hypothetical protein